MQKVLGILLVAIAALTLVSALTACKNPVDHFTDERRKVREIECGEVGSGTDDDGKLVFIVSDSTCTRVK